MSTMQAHNSAAMASLVAKAADAEAHHGEVEVRDALIARADHWASIGDKTAALAAYDVALAKTVGAGPRLDIVFATMRVALLTTDVPLLKAQLAAAQKLIDDGGDWDRRNRLKVYLSWLVEVVCWLEEDGV